MSITKLSFCILAFWAVCSIALAAEMLTNGGFENGTINESYSDTGVWEPPLCGNPILAVSDTGARSGDYCMSLDPTGWSEGDDDVCGGTDDEPQITIDHTDLPTEWSTVTFSGYLNLTQLDVGEGNTAGAIVAIAINPDDEVPTSALRIQIIVDDQSGYLPFSVSYTNASTRDEIALRLIISPQIIDGVIRQDLSGPVLIDDLSLVFDSAAEGEGEGEGEAGCPTLAELDASAAELAAGLGADPATWPAEDWVECGIPHGALLALVAQVICQNPDVLAAYNANLAAVTDALSTWAGGVLSGKAESALAALATAEPAWCVAIGGIWGADPLSPYTIAKGVNEPLSATGDYDVDGSTNKDEYDNVIGVGGDRMAFALAATWSSTDGSEPLPVAGIIGLTLLAGASLLGGIATLKRR